MLSYKEELVNARLTLKNRLVLPPMATETSDQGGAVSEKLLQYYDEKSRGGCLGLVITEHCFISPEGKASPGQVSIAEDRAMDGLKKLAAVIQGNGTRAVVQINHAGGAAKEAVTGLKTLAPSAKLKDGEFYAHREMDAADIQRITAHFAEAAGQARSAGFDGVEIHSAHGYLLNQFLSPLTNLRDDAYGGDLNGRIRIHLEIIRAVRETAGDDYPIFLRLGALDTIEGGTTIEDAVAACRVFEAAGVDFLDITGGMTGYVRRSRAGEQGYFSDVSEAVRKEVSIPVILTGGITEASAAARLLDEGKADLIGVGRAMLKDSAWARKAMEWEG